MEARFGTRRVDLTKTEFQLLATMVSPEREWSLGVVRDTQDDKKKVGIYRRGDSLPQGAILAQVVDRRIYIVVGKRVEYVDQDGLPPPQAPPPLLSINPAPAKLPTTR